MKHKEEIDMANLVLKNIMAVMSPPGNAMSQHKTVAKDKPWKTIIIEHN